MIMNKKYKTEYICSILLNTEEEFLNRLYEANGKNLDKEIMQFIANLISEYNSIIADKILEEFDIK